MTAWLASDALAPVPLWACAPFAVLLAAIATGPLWFREKWHHHYPKVSLLLGGLVVAYYLLLRNQGGHGVHKLLHTGIEYLSFVALVGALFVAASGVLLRIHARGTTITNVVLLAGASFLSNLVGTTGASMLLIRPYLRMNRGHLATHHVVFFIFLVSNVGGALTPIGDPPLFLGYLKGIPFFWTAEHLLIPWGLAVGALLVLFAGIDWLHTRKVPRAPHGDEKVRIEVSGNRSFLFILAVLGLVLAQGSETAKQLQPWSTLVIALAMIALAAGAYKSASRRSLEENQFTFEPIREVAILFAGIFATMIPALEYLEANAASLGLKAPLGFYFVTGGLSAVLDNAPTYLTFLTADLGLQGLSVDAPSDLMKHLAEPEGARTVAAISCGAVFFGAMTYIGNGPNFMVKSIAESMKAPCPSFFGYLLKWAVPILLPVLVLVGIYFFGSAR